MSVRNTTGHLWLEEGQQREGMTANVAPVVHTHRIYTYAVPASMEDTLAIGQRVRVPLGRSARCVEGFVVDLDRGVWDSTVRPIDSVVDPDSFLTPHLIELGREIARHYVCPLGRTLKAITPEAVRRRRGLKTVRYARLKTTPSDIERSGRRIGPKRKALIEHLATANQPQPVAALLARCDASAGVLRGLVKEGWVEIETRREVEELPPSTVALVEPDYELNDDQRAAVERIHRTVDENRFGVTLLFGVSGSGKTEVYIRAIRDQVAAGRQAILLVPEIVLTTQLVGRLESRLTEVAVLHSGLTGAERSRLWQRIATGTCHVVVGTRSAVFAPCPNLGLLCVDEEQETSFKNLRAPRFHVRDVAIMRAKQLSIPVILGSATPAVETWYHSEHRSDYRRVVLQHRVRELPMPHVHLVDMRHEYWERKKAVVLSRVMERLLGETLSRGEQALLLVNRRGFATRVFCPACKIKLTCPNCSVSLVVHRVSGQAICHYCRAHIPTPTVCPNPDCGERLIQGGMGTQRVEDVLTDRFPNARIQRVDSDTMRHRDQYEQIVDDFENRRNDVLVGTQMIAKGLDFPFVSFVGIVHADPAALTGDFRAHERLFQLITQTAGRAGRADVAGRVVVQTTTPDLPALRFALKHDYEGFVADELLIRRQVGLPPFSRLARIVLEGPREETVEREATALAERIRKAVDALSLDRADVLGPNPCVLLRLRGRYRHDVVVRTANASSLRKLLGYLQESNELRTKAKNTIIDVDPVALS